MYNTQPNKQDNLTVKLLEYTHNNEITISIVDSVKEKCSKYSLCYQKVSDEIIRSLEKAKDIRSVSSYVSGIVTKIITNNPAPFKKSLKVPCFMTLHKAFKAADITGETWELFLIDSIEEHCVNEFNVSFEEMTWTNRAIVEYCKTKNKKTYKDFINFLLKSKLLEKCNVPIVVLEKQARESGNTYDTIMKELEEDESLYGENK